MFRLQFVDQESTIKISDPADSRRSKFGKELKFHIPEHYPENVLTFLVTCSQQECRKLFPFPPLFLCHPTSTFPFTSFLRELRAEGKKGWLRKGLGSLKCLYLPISGPGQRCI